MRVQFILPPVSNVTVNVSVSDPSVASLNTTQLLFTPSNYKTEQQIIMAAASSISADKKFTVNFSTVSSDEACNNVTDSWEYTATPTTKPLVTWTTASQQSVNESGSMTVTAELSAPSAIDITVPFTVTGTASNADRTLSGNLTFTAGTTTKTITITITPDTIVEANETVIFTIGTPTNANRGAITVHTATITNDDAGLPTVAWVGSNANFRW